MRLVVLPAQAQTLFGSPDLDDPVVVGLDSDSERPLDWSGLLGPGHAYLILNLDGCGVVLGESIRLSVFPGTIAVCRIPPEGKVYASRLPGSGRHRCVVARVNGRWVTEKFGRLSEALHPLFFREPEDPREQLGATRLMSLAELDLCSAMLAPPVPRALRPMWFRAKLIECLILFGSVHPGQAAKRAASDDRIDRAILWLRENFDRELDLKKLSTHVGCAPHYLSRLFRAHTGKTLSQKLRQIRIDQAASLLHDGRNVTEAALEVGYNSLSHFTKAFILEKGVRPSLYRNS